MSSRIVQVAFVAAAVVGISGCDGSSSPSEPAGLNDLTVVSITPPQGTTLSAGQAVTFDATLRYTLSAGASGEISIVIQDQDDVVLQTGVQPAVPVTAGSGVVNLSDSVTIPASGVSLVRVFFALFFDGGGGRTDIATVVTYDVS